MSETFSPRMAALMATMAPVQRFMDDSPWSRMRGQDGVADFALGNPHEMPLAELPDILRRWSVPQHERWFGYPLNEPEAQEVAARSLRERLGVEFEPEDIHMTSGAFGALSLALDALVGPGDEAIYISPPWFFYEGMILHAGGQAVRVKCDPATFDLDLAAIESALTPRTRAIIINSPHNPTGRIYPAKTLKALAGLLTARSERNGRPIYLISDESYRRITFDGIRFESPAAFYPRTLVVYTYGKTLLAPGERIGYLALPVSMPERKDLAPYLDAAHFFTGYAWPNGVLQRAMGELEALSVDIGRLERRRDRVVDSLCRIGYEMQKPEGTFYLMPKSPLEDDWAFIELLGEHNILAAPGAMFEWPGYFRLSLTANDEMVERALPGFEAAFRQAARLRR